MFSRFSQQMTIFGAAARRNLRRPAYALGLALLTFTSMPMARAQNSAPTGLGQQPSGEDIARAVRASGLSQDQIRARLRAAGYNEALLDSYSGTGGAVAAPTPEVLRAVQTLTQGAATERAQASAQAAARPAGLDSVATTIGSVPVFGLDVFRRATTQFEPAVAGPVDAGYRLGPGDVVVVILTGSVELSHSLEVTREGFVVVPQVGQVFLANLSLGQATDVLRRRLEQSYSSIGSTAQLFVTVARLRTNQVFVLGEVAAPGSYQVSAAGTMLSALYAAGGPTVNGTLRRIELRRGGRVIETFDVYDYLLRGDASNDARLEQGDVLFVGRHAARVRIAGEVMRPAWYEAAPGERVANLVNAAGGFTATAVRSRVVVTRILPASERAPGRDRTTFDVAGAQLTAFGVEDGDVVEAFPVSERVRGRIAVAGHVWTPGRQGLREGMTVRDALQAAGGLKPGAYTDEVAIWRRRADDRFERVAVRLDASGIPQNNLTLQEDDSLRVYSREQFTPERYVSIGGAVRDGKRIPWTPGLTLRRALLDAGGVQESALLSEVEVARMPASREGGKLATTQRVPIDSSYIFERGPDGAYSGPPGLPSARAGTVPDFVLQPYDVVNVLRQPDFEYLGSVTLGGEVKFPGAYAITHKGERLADIIQRAGGLTAEADSSAAIFRREVTALQNEDRRRLLSQVRLNSATTGIVANVAGTSVAVSPEASTSYREAVAQMLAFDAGAMDRVNVDLPRLLKDRRDRSNLEMQPGDHLVVPRRNPTVTVKGFVNAPTTVAWVPGASLSYYIARAGGPTATAAEAKAFVLQSNGVVESYKERWWLVPDRDPEVRAGGLVVVPPRDVTDRPLSFTQVLGPITQILASTVAIIAIATR